MLDVIKKRQSIRSYLDKPVEHEKIQNLLKAAMQAPTAMNKQEWRFLVITKRKALDDLSMLSPYMQMMKQAPCAILVIGNLQEALSPEYAMIDCSAAITHILLEAIHQDLGTCWCAVSPVPEIINGIREYYKLEDHLLPVGVVAVGYPEKTRPYTHRFDEAKISYVNEASS